jgi:pSer/pThr/pTyr-binding forkhead associated (FHA) protein
MKLVFPGGEHPQVLLGQGVNRVGSDPMANIVLDRPGVLPQHCQLHVTDQAVMLSVSPGIAVSVNGHAVDGLIALRAGDNVCFDGIQARLAALDPTAAARHRALAAGCAQGAANDDPGATAVRPVLPQFVLRGISGSVFGRTFPLLGPMSVGRADECALQLGDEGLSRRHARLIPTADGVQLEDLGSTNGCFINGARVLRGVARSGDEIVFDAVRFRVLGPASEAGLRRRPMQITATPGRRPAAVVVLGSAWLWTALAASSLVVLVALAFLG